MWKLICEMGGNMRVKSLYAYYIKNDISDVNSKEILMQSNKGTSNNQLSRTLF